MAKGRKGTPPGQAWLLEQPTLPEVVRWYDEHVISLKKPGTAKTYRWICNWWAQNLPEHPAGADVVELLSGLVRAGELEPGTANMRVRILGRCLKVARSRWRLLHDFTCSAECPRIPEAPPKPRALADPQRTWPLLLAVMPDAQARAFLTFQRDYGLGSVRRAGWRRPTSTSRAPKCWCASNAR